MAGNGHSKPAAGHFMSKDGHTQGNLETRHAERGTDADVSLAPCGQFQSTTRAQSGRSKHNHSTMDAALPPDLRLVVGAWERLPEVVRAAIMGMVKGAVKAK
jgi:hypothetical protein